MFRARSPVNMNFDVTVLISTLKFCPQPQLFRARCLELLEKKDTEFISQKGGKVAILL